MPSHYLLLVDDEKPLLESLSRLLQAEFPDLPVYTADSGTQALETAQVLELQGWEPAVVLSDLMMPGMTGDVVLGTLRDHYPQMKALLLSGRADVDSLGRAINRANIYRYLPKPWDLDDLLATLREALKSFQQERQLEKVHRQMADELTLLNHLAARIRRSRNFQEIQASLQEELRVLMPQVQVQLGIQKSRGLRLEIWGPTPPSVKYLIAEVPPLAAFLAQKTPLVFSGPRLSEEAWAPLFLPGDFDNRILLPFQTESGLRGVLMLTGSDPELLPVLETVTALSAAASELVFLLAEEVSARKAAEEASGIKSRFLANMSHEIRTPMNAILGFTRVLLESQDIPELHKENLTIIQSSGLHLLNVINDVLDMSKIEAGKMVMRTHPFHLTQTLEKVRQLFELQCRTKGLVFTLQVDPVTPLVLLGDEAKILQILINLVSNSLKYTSRGEITLDVKPGESSDKIFFTVADSGSGIPDEDQERIFQPFVRGQDGKEIGTGLGLSICRHLVESMGGRLSLRSQIKKGTVVTFYLKLPRTTLPPLLMDHPVTPPSLLPSPIRPPAEFLTSKALKALPAAWRRQFLQTLDLGTGSVSLLEDLGPEWEPFRRAIKDLLNRKESTKLKELLEQSL